MLNVAGLSNAFGGRQLFDDVSRSRRIELQSLFTTGFSENFFRSAK